MKTSSGGRFLECVVTGRGIEAVFDTEEWLNVEAEEAADEWEEAVEEAAELLLPVRLKRGERALVSGWTD